MKSPLIALVVLLLAVPAVAQVQGGNIYGTVTDEQGAVLPGVVVTINGSDRTQSVTTGPDGKYRFISLPPGSYKVSTTLAGFATTVTDSVMVQVGSNVELPFALKLASVEQAITVTGEAPIVDTKAMGTATNFTQAELNSVPTSRDPWALLRTVPGVMVDRVNIAGNETGQQSNFQSKGTRPQDAVWTMDGVVITDYSAVGASPTYFNYDNFEEVQVSTSGQDIRQATGGRRPQLRGQARAPTSCKGRRSRLLHERLARGTEHPVRTDSRRRHPSDGRPQRADLRLWRSRSAGRSGRTGRGSTGRSPTRTSGSTVGRRARSTGRSSRTTT